MQITTKTPTESPNLQNKSRAKNLHRSQWIMSLSNRNLKHLCDDSEYTMQGEREA